MQVQIVLKPALKINALPKSAGDKTSLKPKEDFERLPHRQGGAHASA
jgi:hypothetical protein